MATNSVLDYEFTIQNLKFKESCVYNNLLTNVLNKFSLQVVDVEVCFTGIVSLLILSVFLRILWTSMGRFESKNVESAPNKTIDAESVSQEPCPICYELITFPVRTNCHHVFCGECMLMLLKSAHLKSIVCPMCRLKVRKILPKFPQGQSNFSARSNSKVVELIVELEDYNVWFSDSSYSFLANIMKCPVFVRRLKRSLHNLNILEFMLYNRMVYVKACILGFYVGVQLFGCVSCEQFKSVALIVIIVLKVTLAAHTVTILIRRYRQQR